MPNEACENLKKIFVAKTTTRKLQLRQELKNIQQRDMSITNYTLKNKELCDSLYLIKVNVEDDEMVQIGQGYWSYIKGAQENRPDPTTPEYSTWEQTASRVMCCVVTCVHDHMLGYIRESSLFLQSSIDVIG